MRLSRYLPVLAVLLFAFPAAAQDWTAPARSLVREAFAKAGSPAAVSVTIQIRAGGLEHEQPLQTAVESALRAANVKIAAAAPAMPELRVTLSENTRGLLLVGEIILGDRHDVVLVPVARPATAQTATSITLRRRLLWSQSVQILDIAFAAAAPDQPATALAVLDVEGVSTYGLLGNTWKLEQRFTFGNVALPRDPRGRIFLKLDRTLEVFLPGTKCAGNDTALNCVRSDDPWPISANAKAPFVASRNYFSGAVISGGTSRNFGPFYSASEFRGQWLVAGTDGVTHVFAAPDRPVGELRGYGSDLIALRTACGADEQLLVSRDSDWAKPDSLQLVGNFASSPFAFNGPITEMRKLTDREALAIARDLKTGIYEAYSVAADCGN